MTARQIGWMSANGQRLRLPVQGHGEAKCPTTGETYVLNGERLIRTGEEQWNSAA